LQVTDTVLMVGINIVSRTGSNLIDPNDHTPLTPERVSQLEYGSKMILVIEEMQIMTVWLAKACLLIMYGRLTLVQATSVLRDNRLTRLEA
jgi:hypothetical protein